MGWGAALRSLPTTVTVLIVSCTVFQPLPNVATKFMSVGQTGASSGSFSIWFQAVADLRSDACADRHAPGAKNHSHDSANHAARDCVGCAYFLPLLRRKRCVCVAVPASCCSRREV